MSEKFRNKYRIPSHRKPRWDYSADALYFLTIVTQNRICNLGEIVEMFVETHGIIVKTHGCASLRTYQMKLSDFGKIVETEWFKSFEIRRELFLHEFVIMPNHLHAIVKINNPNRINTNVDTNVETHVDINVETHVDINVETHGRASLHDNIHDDNAPNETELLSIKRNPPKRMPRSISSFMAGFKSGR